MKIILKNIIFKDKFNFSAGVSPQAQNTFFYSMEFLCRSYGANMRCNNFGWEYFAPMELPIDLFLKS